MEEDLEQRIKQVYRTHYKDVYHFLLYFTGNQSDTEDLTQEVFIRLLHALPHFDGVRASLKTWILSIAKHVAVDQHRKKKFQLLFADKWMKRLPATTGLPDVEFEAKEEEQLIEEALQRLKPQYRMVIILRCIKGYSIKETADILECTEAKVKVDYHRAIKMLQQKFHVSGKGGWLHELVK